MGGCWKNSKNNNCFIIYVEIVALSCAVHAIKNIFYKIFKLSNPVK